MKRTPHQHQGLIKILLPSDRRKRKTTKTVWFVLYIAYCLRLSHTQLCLYAAIHVRHSLADVCERCELHCVAHSVLTWDICCCRLFFLVVVCSFIRMPALSCRYNFNSNNFFLFVDCHCNVRRPAYRQELKCFCTLRRMHNKLNPFPYRFVLKSFDL